MVGLNSKRNRYRTNLFNRGISFISDAFAIPCFVTCLICSCWIWANILFTCPSSLCPIAIQIWSVSFTSHPARRNSSLRVQKRPEQRKKMKMMCVFIVHSFLSFRKAKQKGKEEHSESWPNWKPSISFSYSSNNINQYAIQCFFLWFQFQKIFIVTVCY